MAKQLTFSQAFQGMILEKQAAGLSVHTIADYRNTLAKVQLYFPSDPSFTSITRERLVKFFAWLSNDCVAKPDGAARRIQTRRQVTPQYSHQSIRLVDLGGRFELRRDEHRANHLCS